jgi:RecG-like helicase
MSTKALTLTSKSLEEAGIKTQLTQGDVVDVIVDDLYDKIQDSLENLPKVPNDKEYLVECLKNKFLNELVSSKIITKDQATKYANRVNCFSFTYDSDDKKTITTQLINYYSNTSNKESQRIKMYASTYAYIKECSGKLELVVKDNSCIKSSTGEEVSKEVHTHYSMDITITNTESYKDFKKSVERVGEEHKAIYDSIPVRQTSDYKFLSYTSLSRAVKSKVNKNIIRNQAPDIADQLKSSFSIDI